VIFDELDRDRDYVCKVQAGMAMRMHQLMLNVEAYSL